MRTEKYVNKNISLLCVCWQWDEICYLPQIVDMFWRRQLIADWRIGILNDIYVSVIFSLDAITKNKTRKNWIKKFA